MATRIAQTKTGSVIELDSRVELVQGDKNGKGLRMAVLVADFNADITNKLLVGALEVLNESGVEPEHIKVYRVPGAWELPLATERILAADAGQKSPVDAVIALGAVIRGDTPHFDYVCSETSRGLMQVALQTGRVVTFGVLTTDDLAQAEERAGGALGNKGGEAAQTALQMVTLYRQLQQ